MNKSAFFAAALLVFGGVVAAQDARTEKVKVPLEALGELLKRNPHGRLLSEKDWQDLLAQAGVKDPSDLGGKPEIVKPPVSWTVSGATFDGRLDGEQVVFAAEATVQVLEAKAVLVPLPLAVVGARDVKVDGTDAKLVRGDGGYSVLIDGAGEKKIAWTFAVPVEKGEERGAGAFLVPLLASSVATSLQISLPAKLDVSSAQCALSVSHPDKPITLVRAACGAREAIKVEFRPLTAEAEQTPFVTVEDASCFVVRRGLVQLELAAHFAIHRTGKDRLAIDLPAGFVVRSLDASVRDRSERAAAPWGGNWVQRGDQVELALPKARQGELAVVLRAECVAPQEGALDLRVPAYPGCARSSGLVGVARGEDMDVVVSGAKALERADLDALPARNLAGVLRVYRHGSATGQVGVALKPIEPKVALALRGKEQILDRELRLEAVYDFRVLEGKVYQFRCQLPEAFRVDETSVTDLAGDELKHDLKTTTAAGRTTLAIDLEGGVAAGQALRVLVKAAREVPSGIASEKSLVVPTLAGAPATQTAGYLGFVVDEAFRLKGDVSGLLPVPVEAIARAGLPAECALGFKVDRPDYAGSLELVKKDTRIAARSVVYYQVDERTIATDAKLDFDIEGAPVESLDLVLPDFAAKLVRIDGDEVAGDAAGDSKDGVEHHTVRLKGPKSGRVTLFVHFEQQVAGFAKAEGAAKTQTQLPVIHAGLGCERERGQVAVFSSDSTEITAAPEHLHVIEGTEVEPNPAVKPAGRPLCAFTYAGLDWKLGIEIVRHEGASVLAAIVEQLNVVSSFGRDGVSRHTATFRVKNLSHQFFNLKVPEGAQIWSVLVDGVGVKPAADGDQKIIPLTKAGSPDQAVTVAVTYEVKNAPMGKLGTGALASPVLLERRDGDAIPVLKTGWSLSLPDDFRYVEFSGNADGAQAAIDRPLVAQWWDENPDQMVLLGGIAVFVLALLAGEKSRAKLAALGQKLLGALVSAPKAARKVPMPSKRVVVGVAGFAILALVVFALIPTLGAKRYRAQSAAGRLERVTKKITAGDEDDAGAPQPTSKPAPAGGMDKHSWRQIGDAPPPPPPPMDGERAGADQDEFDDRAAGEKKPATKPVMRRDARMKRKASKEEAAPEEPQAPAEKPAAAPGQPAPEPAIDAKPTDTLSLSTNGPANYAMSVEKTRAVDLDAAKKRPAEHRALSTASAFGEKGLPSLVLALPDVGKTWTFTHEGGPAEIGFTFVRTDVWSVGLALLAIAGFAAGFVIPRKTRFSYLATLTMAVVLLSTVPYVIAPSLTGGPVNAFLAGLILSGPVIALLSIDRARLRRVRLIGFVPPRMPSGGAGAALVVFGAMLFAASPARAQDRKVFIPYDPEHPDKKQDKVFVPEDLYDELWHKAHPNAKVGEKVTPPAAYAVSGVKYEGSLATGQDGTPALQLTARFRLEILQEGWVEAPIGLEGASILEQVIAPEGAKVRPSASGYAILAQGPKTFDLTLKLLLPRQGGVFAAGAIRAGAATMALQTAEKDMAIKVVGALGGQTESASAMGGVAVDASLGAAPRIQIAYGAREVIAVGGASDATAESETLHYVRRGRVELTQRTTFQVSGDDGREAFTFTVPSGFEVTSVDTEALRSWSVKDGVLTVSLRRPCKGMARVIVKGERATKGASIDLPEIAARAVTREEGKLAIAVESGLKVRFGSDEGLRQVEPSEIDLRAAQAAERAYSFPSRPAKLGLELLDEPLDVKCTSHTVGVVRADRFDVLAELEYFVKKGRTFELRVLAPSELELASDPEGLDVRERVVEKLPAGTRYTFGLAKALTANTNATLRLHFTRTLRQDDKRVATPDVRALDVTQEDGEVALCAAEGLSLKTEREVEADRFSSLDPEPIARALRVTDAKPLLGWRRKAKAPSGLSAGTATIEHPSAHVEGTAVTFAVVERDVVHTTVRVFYELSEAGAKEFSFTLPASLAKRASVVAPNQREISFGAAFKDGDEERVPFTVSLQSAVKNFYELCMEWELPIAPSGQIDLARLDLVKCDRVRHFVLVEADASLTDKLEAAKARCANVESVRAEQAYALPPGKDPRDFAECFRAEREGWKVGLDLKPVEQQAPAPCRVESARVTSVIHDDGSILHRAVWRVRNRTLQFLAVKLPKGATVWTVHVAGEPKRLHTENGLALIPLPKRADADMGFEVEVIFKTQLDGPLGLLKKVTPAAPVLATKGVTVERTFWTIHLPPKFDAAWTGGNMDETVEAVSQGQEIKARVQELAKLSSLAQSAKTETERQLAYSNVQSNMALVQRDYDTALGLMDGALANAPRNAKVNQLLVQTRRELEQLRGALGEVQKRLVVISGKRAELAQQRSQNAQQVEVVYGANKFVNEQAGWRVSTGAFKADRGQQWEGLDSDAVIDRNYDQAIKTYEGVAAQQQQQAQQRQQTQPGQQILEEIDQLKAQQNRVEDEKVEKGRKFENERRQHEDDKAGKDKEITAVKREYEIKLVKQQRENEELAKRIVALRGRQNGPDANKPIRLGREGIAGTYGTGGEGAGKGAPTGGNFAFGGGAPDTARARLVTPSPAKTEAPRRVVRERDIDLPVDQPELQTPPAPPKPSNGYFQHMDESDSKKNLLSIGFDFEVPAGSEALHFTTDSQTEDGMQLSLTVVPRTSVERGARIGRALCVLLLVLAVAKLGLLSSGEKPIARALGLVCAAAVAGLVFVHVAFAAVAVVGSIGALIRARSLRAS